MENSPLITIIVPVYNAEPYLDKCVDSLVNQTYKNIEIILVNDGSTDNSGALCYEFAKKDSRIKAYHQENTGQAGARNYGISIAKGDYIGFVDSDDYITHDMYEVMLNAIIENDCDISVCGRYSVRGDEVKVSGFNIEKPLVMDTKEAVKRFLTYKSLDGSPCDKLCKKELLDGVRFPLGYICEDVPFVYEILSKAKKVVHCAKPLYYYVVRQGSTSRVGYTPRSMGMYHHFKSVSEKCKQEFPSLSDEADFIYLKNLVVLAFRIGSEKGFVPERKMINGEVRKNIGKILKCKYMKNTYKFLSLAIVFGLERICLKFSGKIAN